MQNVIAGQAAAVTATAHPCYLATLRRYVLTVVGNPLFTDAEQLRATHNTSACTCSKRLALWFKNVQRVAAERQASQHEAAQDAYKKAAARVRRLTARRNELFAQCCSLRPDGFPVYAYAENPNRAQLDAAHTAALEASRLALAAQEQVQQLEPQATLPLRYATPSQCDELYRLACHPALTPTEKAQTLALLPTLTQGAAVACIGQLYTQVLRRAGQPGWRDGSTLLAA